MKIDVWRAWFPPPRILGKIGYGACALLSVFLGLYFYPPNQVNVGHNLDQSHVWAVAWALQNGYTWGADILFTYGPLGYIRSRSFLPEGNWILVFSGYLYYGLTGFLLWRFFKPGLRSHPAGGLISLVFLIVYLALDASYDPVVLFLLMAGGYFSFQKDKLSRMELAAFLIFCGLNFYIKYTFTVLICFLFLFYGILRLLKRIPGNRVLGLPASVLLVGISLGVTPVETYLYLINSWPLAAGYSKAMHLWGEPSEWIVFLAILFLMNGAFFYNLLMRRPGGIFPFHYLWISLVAFLVWKLAFVRHDAHAMIGSSFLIPAALFFIKDSWEERAKLPGIRFGISAALLVAALFFAIGTHGRLAENYREASHFEKRWKASFSKPVSKFKRRLILPLDREAMLKRYERQLTTLGNRLPLPPMDGNVDFYNARSGILLSNRLEYNPRPVFQSYSAYTPGLILKNRDHLLGPEAPDYLITDLATIAYRPPMLGDGLSWLEIFRYYRPFWLKERRLAWERDPSGSHESVQLEPVSEGEGKLKEALSLEDYAGEPLWIELEFKKNLPGKLQSLLFKPSALKLEMVLYHGKQRKIRRIEPSMTETGFLLSPYLAHPEQLLLFLAGAKSGGFDSNSQYLDSIRIVEERSLLRTFEKAFRYRIYRVRYEGIPAFRSDFVDRYEDEYWGPLHHYSSLKIQKEQSRPKVVNNEELGYHLFAHAPLGFSLPNNFGDREMSIRYGLYDGSWQNGNETDGVTFRITGITTGGEKELLFEHEVTPAETAEDRGTQEALFQVSGNHESLYFETGTIENSKWDWSYWGPLTPLE